MGSWTFASFPPSGTARVVQFGTLVLLYHNIPEDPSVVSPLEYPSTLTVQYCQGGATGITQCSSLVGRQKRHYLSVHILNKNIKMKQVQVFLLQRFKISLGPTLHHHPAQHFIWPFLPQKNCFTLQVTFTVKHEPFTIS